MRPKRQRTRHTQVHLSHWQGGGRGSGGARSNHPVIPSTLPIATHEVPTDASHDRRAPQHNAHEGDCRGQVRRGGASKAGQSPKRLHLAQSYPQESYRGLLAKTGQWTIGSSLAHRRGLPLGEATGDGETAGIPSPCLGGWYPDLSNPSAPHPRAWARDQRRAELTCHHRASRLGACGREA